MTCSASWTGTTPGTDTPPVASARPTTGTLVARLHSLLDATGYTREPEPVIPKRWSRVTRNWTPAGLVRLGPAPNLTSTVQEMKRIR